MNDKTGLLKSDHRSFIGFINTGIDFSINLIAVSIPLKKQ
jgi:hypothetical protein